VLAFLDLLQRLEWLGFMLLVFYCLGHRLCICFVCSFWHLYLSLYLFWAVLVLYFFWFLSNNRLSAVVAVAFCTSGACGVIIYMLFQKKKKLPRL
jgi:hypothetical protein